MQPSPDKLDAKIALNLGYWLAIPSFVRHFCLDLITANLKPKPGQARPGQAKPGQARSHQTTPDHTRPDQTMSDPFRPGKVSYSQDLKKNIFCPGSMIFGHESVLWRMSINMSWFVMQVPLYVLYFNYLSCFIWVSPELL